MTNKLHTLICQNPKCQTPFKHQYTITKYCSYICTYLCSNQHLKKSTTILTHYTDNQTKGMQHIICKNPNCKQIFTYPNKRKKYCSRKCINEMKNNKPTTGYNKICANTNCNTIFQNKDPKIIYCSENCKKYS